MPFIKPRFSLVGRGIIRGTKKVGRVMKDTRYLPLIVTLAVSAVGAKTIYEISEARASASFSNDLEYLKKINGGHTGPLKSSIEAELKRLNRGAKSNEIFFFDPSTKKFEKVSLNFAKLNKLYNIKRMLYPQQEKQLGEIVARRMAAIEKEAKIDPKIMRLIISKAGSLDIEKYLLSLPLDELEKLFSHAEKTQIREIVESISPKKLSLIKRGITDYKMDTGFKSSLEAFAVSLLLLNLLNRRRSTSA